MEEGKTDTMDNKDATNDEVYENEQEAIEKLKNAEWSPNNNAKQGGHYNDPNYSMDADNTNQREHDPNKPHNTGYSSNRNQRSKTQKLRSRKQQKKQAFPIKTHTIDDIIYPVMTKKGIRFQKKQKRRPDPMAGMLVKPKQGKLLDGFLLLDSCMVKLPHEAIRSKLVDQNILEVVEEDLCYFQNLTFLDISDNRVKVEQLANLTNLVELYIQFNQIDALLLTEGMFPQLEKLYLSYNNIPANNLQCLGFLKKLTLLDLASNDLVTLPESLDFLQSVEELNLSSNQFSSDSTLVKPSKIFYSASTMPTLKRLNLSRNKFSAFHYEDLSEDSFPVLQELDFSYNLVEDQSDMLYCQNIKNLLALTITGNPFSQRGKQDYEELERVLSTVLSAVVINRTEFSSRIAKRLRLRQDTNDIKSLPYPKPMTLLSREVEKYEGDEEGDNKKIKQKLLDVEMSKGIALPITDMRLTTNQEEEIFPENKNDKDVFTPPNDEPKQDDANFFITGDGAEYPTNQQQTHENQEPKNIIKELHSQESGDEDEPKSINEAERQIQDK